MKIVRTLPLLALLAATADGDVLVVSSNGDPGTFAKIQDAVDAAEDGDLIRVEYFGADYGGFDIVSKSVEIVGCPGAYPSFRAKGIVRIAGLEPEQRVSIRGMNLYSDQTWINRPVFEARDVEGVLSLEDCNVSASIIYQEFAPTMRLDGVAHAVFRGLEVKGASGGTSTIGAPALEATESTIYAFDTDVEGGSSSIDGGVGSRFDECDLYLQGSTVTGGDGGNNIVGFEGGTGIVATGSGEIWLIGATVEGGSGGWSFSEEPPGDDGAPLDLAPTMTLHQFEDVGKKRTEASPLVGWGSELYVDSVGLSGDTVFVYVDVGWPQIALNEFVPAIVAVGASARVIPVGTIPGGANHVLKTFEVPPAPPGALPLSLVFQSVFVERDGAIAVGGASRSQVIRFSPPRHGVVHLPD